jgi:predicted transcriptional regulator
MFGVKTNSKGVKGEWDQAVSSRAIDHSSGERIGYNSGYTRSMKTAVSLPDDLFRAAEIAARRLNVSRSRLYAAALSHYLDRRQAVAVTERLNKTYAGRPA